MWRQKKHFGCSLTENMIDLLVLYDRWDVLSSDFNHIKAVDGHCDLLHGTFDLKYLRWFAPLSLSNSFIKTTIVMKWSNMMVGLKIFWYEYSFMDFHVCVSELLMINMEGVFNGVYCEIWTLKEVGSYYYHGDSVSRLHFYVSFCISLTWC